MVEAARRGRRPCWDCPSQRGLAAKAVLVAALTALPAGVWIFASAPSAFSAASGGPFSRGSIQVAPAFVPGPGVQDLGAVPSGRTIDVAVALALQDPTGLAARTALEYAPGSPSFHRFLSTSYLADQYGPSTRSYRAAVAYFEGQGLTVTTSPDRMMMVVAGPSRSVAAAFHTQFEQYSVGGKLVFSHPTAASLPAGLPWAGVVGLGNSTPPTPAIAPVHSLLPLALPTCSSSAPFAPCAIEEAYNTSGLLTAGTNGTGYRIGVVDTYDGSENQTTLARDLAGFDSAYGVKGGTVQYLYPVPTGANLNATSTGWGLEESLDIEWSHAMAPGATVKMTFAPDPTAGLYGAVDWLVAHQAVDALSLSWGEPDVGVYNSVSSPCSVACNATSDGSYTLLHPVLAEAAAEGIGVFSSSGDCGAADGTGGVSTSYPASDPAVTGVGGTVLVLKNGTYSSESGWSGNVSGASGSGCQNQGGSGGGFAPFGRPFWQTGPGVPSAPATRGVPDVALVGGSPVSISYNGFGTAVEGTSAGSPMWAAFEVIADQKVGHALGSLNPALYRLAASPSASAYFHDVTSGWNGYSAGTGWDAVTGLGSPDVGRLSAKLTTGILPPSSISVGLAANPRYGSAPLLVTFYVNESGGSGGYRMVDVDFGDGQAAFAQNGRVNHSYPKTGAFVGRATVFDSAGNSSTSPPVVIGVGGSGLNVSLTASRVSLPAGQSVTLSASAAGGLAPYRYWFSFGDGTYLDNTSLASVVHTFPLAGDFCTAVVATDAAKPPNAGLSDRLAITVGGGTPRSCDNAAPLTVNFTSSVLRADVPGDLPLSVSTAGGTPPFSVRYVSDDPYVGACNCGIFHRAGNHTVTAFVNDSVNREGVARINVTILPALSAAFGHSALSGPAPFTATFSAQAIGGDGTTANGTQWTFADGGSATGANVTHTWGSPGFYLVLGVLNDSARGVTSAAFLVDVLPISILSPLALTASVTPAVKVPAGLQVAFAASASGGVGGPYTYRWNLGDGDSGFGPTLTQTFPASACLANGTCPLTVALSVVDAGGTTLGTSIDLTQPVQGRYSAVSLADLVAPLVGPTPLHVNGSANASGVSGLAIGWSFGDGGSAAGTAASHTYYTAGNYTLADTAQDPSGDALVRTHAVVVTGPARTPPSVTGGPNVSHALAPLPVGFNVSATGGSPPYSFAWQFGDGGSAAGARVNHTYAAPGFFNATVTVTDALDSTNTTTFPLTAYAPTVVALAASVFPTSASVGSTVRLTVWATVTCTPLSPPPCVVNTVEMRFAYLPLDGGAPIPLGVATPGITGGLVLAFPTPTVAGGYLLNATVVGANFTGSVEVPVTIFGSTGGTAALLPFTLPPLSVLLVGVSVGVVLAAGFGLAWRQNRASPSRRPSAPDGRRDG
ncbi:MAG TPA: PKD domain-containing protein [Thermoplasmata archaeon]|nr:PKD domain-containing protein [Thermoplasmata archaeon]